MKLGMVGLPNVGKSTLFNALTNAGAESANYPFCTIEKNVGIVSVPDERLDKLAEMYEPDKFTPATLEFVDIAGLVKGASKGEGLGNKFLADIREVDAIVHVVRCFEDPNIIHVDGSIDPLRDIETINLELIFSDIEIVERRIDRAKKAVKGDKKYLAEIDFLERLKEHLENGKSARGFDFTDDERELIKSTPLLSAKPVIYAANLSEDDFVNNIDSNENYKKVCALAAEENSAVLPICAQIEAEISDMSDEDKAMFLSELGLEILEMVNTFSEVNHVPVPYVIGPRRAGDLATVYADPAKAKQILGWEAKKTLADMCRDSWCWQTRNPSGY